MLGIRHPVSQLVVDAVKRSQGLNEADAKVMVRLQVKKAVNKCLADIVLGEALARGWNEAMLAPEERLLLQETQGDFKVEVRWAPAQRMWLDSPDKWLEYYSISIKKYPEVSVQRKVIIEASELTDRLCCLLDGIPAWQERFSSEDHTD